MFATDDSILAIPIAPDPPRVLGSAVPMVDRVRTSVSETGAAQFAVSAEGTLM